MNSASNPQTRETPAGREPLPCRRPRHRLLWTCTRQIDRSLSGRVEGLRLRVRICNPHPRALRKRNVLYLGFNMPCSPLRMGVWSFRIQGCCNKACTGTNTTNTNINTDTNAHTKTNVIPKGSSYPTSRLLTTCHAP